MEINHDSCNCDVFEPVLVAGFHSGATWSEEGTNFSVFSHDAINIELRLYEAAESTEPFQVIALDPNTQRTFFAWHVFVEQLPVGTYYTWRVQRPDGSWWEVLDPWALAVSDDRLGSPSGNLCSQRTARDCNRHPL